VKLVFEEHLTSSSSISHCAYSTNGGAAVGKILFGVEHTRFPEAIRLSRADAIVALARSGWKQVIEERIDTIRNDIGEEPSAAVKEKLQAALS